MQAATEQMPHPALRWVTPSDGWGEAHRMGRDGSAVCGAVGPFTRAGAAKVLCPVCYRAPARLRNVRVRR